MERLQFYFPNLNSSQVDAFSKLESLYTEWNAKINVISRKDIQDLYEKHVLHSLAIAKVQEFLPESDVLDVGTGGGFPGIPLAILFPETQFHLVDSIGKKIKVVQEISAALDLKNIKASHMPAQQVSGHFDFIVSRAVTQMENFVPWVEKKCKTKSRHELKNGILYLKGGDLSEELAGFPKAKQYNISNYFTEEFFETKKVVYLGLR
jgi:16S rRNA (guanine527-N7)-methyltransferase